MFNPAKISASLIGIVGLRQSYNPAYAILDTANTSSRSGLFVTDNSYAKIEFLKDTQDYDAISDEDFNGMLASMQKASIVNVCSQVFSKADFIDRNLIYKFPGPKVETENLPAGFVGRRIQVSTEKNVAINITRVLLDFSGTGAFDLMLFNTAQLAPIFTKEIVITSDHQSEPLNWVLDNSGTTYKGDYYIGYISTGLSVAPYQRNWENGIIETYFSCLDIRKVFVSNYNDNVLFDIRKVQQLNATDGLNLDITVYEDFTDLIINNEALFARAIYLDFVISFLHKYQTSTRSNRNQRLTDAIVSRAVLEIEGSRGVQSPVVVQGLRPQFMREISQIKDEIDKLKSGYFGDGMFTETLD